MHNFKYFFLGAALALLANAQNTAIAMDSTETLPAGINSPAFRFGMVSGVDSKYNADGSVQTLNEINTIRFDSTQLAKLNPEVTDLVTILNQYSQQQLGSQIDLGTLRAETQPKVKYLAPIYARGLTDTISVAIAAPIVFYQNQLRLTQGSSNVRAICDQFAGIRPTLPDLDRACSELDVKVTDAVANELEKQGYKPIANRSETVFGDMLLVGLYRFFDQADHSAMMRTSITLPTGQKNNPDDLADLGVFGQKAVEPMLYYNWLASKKLRFAAKLGYKYVLPDTPELRVPGSEGDILPGPSSKENVSRKQGGTLTTGAALNIGIGDAFLLAGGYEFAKKWKDSISGERGARYDLLEKDSYSEAHRLRAQFSYDTIALYQKTKSVPPLKLDFEVSNTVAGINSDRQLVNELSLTMFF